MDTDSEREKSRLINFEGKLRIFYENHVIEAAEVVIAFEWSSEVKEKIRKRIIMK